MFTTVTMILCCLGFSSEPQEFMGARKDGSVLKGYLSPPEGKDTFPIAILCQGSYSEKSSTQSAYPFHQMIAPFFNEVGIGVVSIEKKGVDRETFDPVVFHDYNIPENRLDDCQRVLELLRTGKLSGWNSQLILIGTSEGGWLAPPLGVCCPETFAVLVFGGPGAWKFKDAIISMLKKHGSSLTEEEIELQFKVMQENPSSQKFWLQQTYKFWAHVWDYADYENILKLSCPVYLSIGSKDDMIESSDALWQLIQEEKKTNVTYARYEGLTHNMVDDRYTVFQDAAKWISKELDFLKPRD